LDHLGPKTFHLSVDFYMEFVDFVLCLDILEMPGDVVKRKKIIYCLHIILYKYYLLLLGSTIVHHMCSRIVPKIRLLERKNKSLKKMHKVRF
jgi:hypothetical protein